ncbi:MAG: methylenetetrahydrofolate reductase C-terminal domain-containing protein [Coriobacteriales bacterium]|nr:methylenetetrahydrofolate reductase C-terminal domain-containing protein [Coriobacteriales bacterium]
MAGTHNPFREAIESGEFCISCELVPGRGANETSQQRLLENAQRLWATRKVHAISITDAPGGNLALLADTLCQDLVDKGITPLLHLTCKDRNRNQLEGQLYAAQRTGIQNLLCMTGDYPSTGWNGRPRPVYDLDPITLLQMVGSMNKGMGYPNPKGQVVRTQASDFFAGAVVSPFKWTEAETLTQFYKLKKKVFAGARFIVSQVGYDARKLQEMLWLMGDAGIDVPLIANVYILSAGAGAAMNRGAIPGCDVSDAFLATLREERDQSPDKGLLARLQRAAKMVAIARGLGCAGVHLGGPDLDATNLELILDMAADYQRDWVMHLPAMSYPQEGCFHYYEQDTETGLNAPTQAPRTESFADDRDIQGNYRMSRRFHKLFFVPGKGLNSAFMKHQRKLEEQGGRLHPHGFEHRNKVRLYDCMDCGDCGLYATAYTCPMVHCPKCQRNGPCGGSKDGWCEVYPGQKRCIWFTAYHRLKPYGEQESLAAYVVPPNDWSNFGKSPWGATATGRDGYARRMWLPGVEPDDAADGGIPPADDAPKVW